MNNCYIAVGIRMFHDTLRNRTVAALKKKLPTHVYIWITPLLLTSHPVPLLLYDICNTVLEI